MLDDLTGHEQALVAAACEGRELICAPGTEIRAELVRELLLGKRGEVAPRGVELRTARLTGGLDLDHVTAVTGISLVDCDIPTPVNLYSATVPWLVLSGCRLGGVHASRLRVAGDLVLSGARLSGGGEDGVIRMHGAHVGGELNLHEARLSGTTDLGAISLRSARVGYDVYVVDSELRNDSGPAIYADGLQVEGAVVLMRSRLSGAGDGGAVWLLGARVGGLRCVEVELRNDSGPALFADQLETKGILLLQSSSLSGMVRLASARVGGQFSLIDTTIEALDVNEFRYASLAGVDWRRWLVLIRDHTKEYRPSPYQQLAAVERAAGHDGNARNILISQQHDLRHRAPHALGGRLTRRFHWLWGALAGYGYRARRTALALLVALMAAGAVSLWAGHVQTGPGRHAAEHTATTTAPGTPCSAVELVGLGIDRGLPLAPTGLRSRCDLDTETTAGQVFTVLLWVVQAAVWGLATLALAGYTGLIRKTA